jgi:hypothetical protein
MAPKIAFICFICKEIILIENPDFKISFYAHKKCASKYLNKLKEINQETKETK